MKIGMVVYSNTGHTLSVAEKLREKLVAAGHAVTLTELETIVPLQMGDTTAELKTLPVIDNYDALVLATCVRGGTPAPPMRVYLEKVSSLADKPVVCLVTGVFPFANWGRDQTLAQMKALCEAKGAQVMATESVGWMSPGRGKAIHSVVERLARLF